MCSAVVHRHTLVASLSLDLDDKWSYMRTHGDADWESFPSYLELVVPRVMSFLTDRQLAITIFIVGRDAARPQNRDLMRSIAAAGHEVGNHSFEHEPWLHLYTDDELQADVSRAEDCIEAATGQRPKGFRAPGYSLTPNVLRVLGRKGYEYDASAFPNIVAPIARAYYFTTTEFAPAERRRRRLLGGTLRDSLRPIKPYAWRLENCALIEVPVTTMPILRVPIHMSYLMGLLAVARALALQYFRLAMRLCHRTGTQPSILLHPTDFLGCEDVRGLSFIPGMNLPAQRKLEFLGDVLGILAAEFRVVTVGEHARRVAQSSELRVIEPRSFSDR